MAELATYMPYHQFLKILYEKKATHTRTLPSNSAASSAAGPVLGYGIPLSLGSPNRIIYLIHMIFRRLMEVFGAQKEIFSLLAGKSRHGRINRDRPRERCQTATAVSTSGARPRPALTNSTITATATSNIPAKMKASK
jgi:hypothetical protein